MPRVGEPVGKFQPPLRLGRVRRKSEVGFELENRAQRSRSDDLGRRVDIAADEALRRRWLDSRADIGSLAARRGDRREGL